MAAVAAAEAPTARAINRGQGLHQAIDHAFDELREAYEAWINEKAPGRPDLWDKVDKEGSVEIWHYNANPDGATDPIVADVSDLGHSV